MAKSKKKVVKKSVKKKSVVKASGKKTPPKKTAAKAAAKPKSAKKSDVVYKLNVGDRVPSFSGDSTSGRAIDQNLHSNRALVLYFYPKDNTPGCTLEGQDFRRLYKQFKSAGAEIVGVSQDSIASHGKFKSKCDFPFELLSDADGSVCKAFDVIQMKSMYGRDFEGIERSTFVIKDGRIAKEWRKVKVSGHAQDVLDSLKSL